MAKGKKRDLKEEIKSIQARTSLQGRYEYYFRLGEIEIVLKQITSKEANKDVFHFAHNRELLRYIPIATVACIQSFFRFAIKELIDSGEPFNKNVANYKGKVPPPDYDIIAAFQLNTLTIGEFVAHSLSYNNYENINSNIGHLLDENLTEKLLAYDRKSVWESVNKNTSYFKDNFSEIRKSIDIIFKMRHTFCHESASDIRLDATQIKRHFYNCSVFLEHSSVVIANIIRPNYPETQLEMNQEARDSYQRKDQELNEYIDKIKSLNKEPFFPWSELDCKDFDQVHEKWKEYRELYASKSSFNSKGGSRHSLLYGSALELITNERLEGLKKQYGHLLKNDEKFSFE